MARYSLRQVFLTLLTGLGFCGSAHASHVVGADMTYTCNGANSYTIRLDLYQDCLNGQQGAIDQDVPGILAVYTGNGNISSGNFHDIERGVPANQIITIPANFSNACVLNYPNTCLQRTTFIHTFILPPNSIGYRVVYQRCCRNDQVVNITQPGNVGATYYVDIPPLNTGSSCNNSATFDAFPPQIICVNNPLAVDFSATDPDGDSLSYELCEALIGGSREDPKPFTPAPPPYAPVNYVSSGGYSATFPVASFPALQLDATTGQLTGTPNLIGRYVVAVCCHEWRNGVRVNTVKREFQFVVTGCSKTVVADIPQFSEEFNTYIVQCNGFTVDFVNNSRGANTSGGSSPWFWDFGVPGTDTDVSTDEEPTFTYPDTGTYLVKLVVNRGSTCPDSIQRIVKIYPTLTANFNISGRLCPKEELLFTDSTFSTYLPLTGHAWTFGDGGSASGPQVRHAYSVGGNYTVTLTARNGKGCIDTAQQNISVERFLPFAGNDTIIVQGERINFRAQGGYFYTWSPGTYLDNTTIANPRGLFPDTGRFGYNVNIRSENGCVGDDSINVWVVRQASIFVPSAFSPNGDGNNDVLRPIAIGFARINYFRVFNRWGQQVFSSSAFGEGVKGEGWDGRIGGVPQDIGTYFWVLSTTNRFGEEEMIKGDATLVR